MNPETRKTNSETLLHKRGIRINLQLPLTESDEEVSLRSSDDVLRRMVALWCVSGAAEAALVADRAGFERFCSYAAQCGADGANWLSAREQAFLSGGFPAGDEALQLCAAFVRCRESMFFLGWCAGIVRKIDLPGAASSRKALLSLLPQNMEAPDRLQQLIRLRQKRDILGWADLLYRLHWAVRHASLIGKTVPGSLDADVVQAWHKAVNWMIGYDDEDDWDLVATDT